MEEKVKVIEKNWYWKRRDEKEWRRKNVKWKDDGKKSRNEEEKKPFTEMKNEGNEKMEIV